MPRAFSKGRPKLGLFCFLGSNKYPNATGEDGVEDSAKMATSYKGAGADWGADASSLSHIFVPTSSSGDSCYLGFLTGECKSSGNQLTS